MGWFWPEHGALPPGTAYLRNDAKEGKKTVSKTKSKKKMLLVEDDDDLRELLEMMLGGDFEVRSCASGAEALWRLRTEPLDVLLTDLSLPDVPGEDLAQAARRLEPNVVIVAMSGDAERLAACRGLADGLIAKPCTFDAFKLALRRALEHVTGKAGNVLSGAVATVLLGVLNLAHPVW